MYKPLDSFAPQSTPENLRFMELAKGHQFIELIQKSGDPTFLIYTAGPPPAMANQRLVIWVAPPYSATNLVRFIECAVYTYCVRGCAAVF
jgi:hypothetical protein